MDFFAVLIFVGNDMLSLVIGIINNLTTFALCF